MGQIKEMKQDGASPNKIDSVVNKAMEVRDKLDNNLNQLDNDLKDEHSHILVPIECIQGLCLVDNMKPDWSMHIVC